MAEAIHAWIDPAAPTVIIERRIIDPAQLPEHKAELWRPVVTHGEDTTYNPLTQKKTGPVTTIQPTQVLDTWTVLPLTEAEIADAQDKAIAAELFEGTNYAVLFRVLLATNNKVRELQGLPPLSAADFRREIKAAL